MNVAIVYAGNSREDKKLLEISKSLSKGLGAQGHVVSIFNAWTDTDARLTYFDFVVVGSCSTGFFSAKINDQLKKFLRECPGASGKRSFAFVTSSLRGNKTLLNLMKIMEAEGMMLSVSQVIKNANEAEAIGKHLIVERK